MFPHTVTFYHYHDGAYKRIVVHGCHWENRYSQRQSGTDVNNNKSTKVIIPARHYLQAKQFDTVDHTDKYWTTTRNDIVVFGERELEITSAKEAHAAFGDECLTVTDVRVCHFGAALDNIEVDAR